MDTGVKRQPTAVTIHLAVVGGHVDVRPYHAECVVGDYIRWDVPEGTPWAVAFGSKGSPGNAAVIQGNGPLMAGVLQAERTGTFPYRVALEGHPMDKQTELKGHKTIYFDAECPDIIVG